MTDEAAILAALGLAADTPRRWEALGESPWSPSLLTIAGEPPLELVVRQPAEPGAAANHAAIAGALAAAGYRYAPHFRAVTDGAVIEEAIPGTTALQLVPPPGAAEAAMSALAAWHALPVREGLDWGSDVADLALEGEVPLHRLGFSNLEREPAREPLREAREYLLASPWGFAHRNATAANVVLAPGQAWLVDFAASGFGAQYEDIAAFLLTSGIEAPGRRALAAAYARHRDVAPDAAADLVDLVGILWGIGWLLELPRRLITNLGDDTATDQLKLCASRIDRGIKQPAGDSPVAAAIRVALWPAD